MLGIVLLFWNLTQFLTTWHVKHPCSKCRRRFTIFQLVTENGSLCFIRLSSAELPAALTRVLFGCFIAQRPCQSSSEILYPASSSKFTEILLEIGRRWLIFDSHGNPSFGFFLLIPWVFQDSGFWWLSLIFWTQMKQVWIRWSIFKIIRPKFI